ncbi:hypothetical protein SAMN05216371_7688 [Streptomyces sp. TLI_053]|uniref:hypothetical protein n=1 Tax=Streptomyces sp. TLI_053 TaxID=1855352 RepID=UPI00087B4526|nr:hypothetical protein [Streptomyces sp. TLI_053]SDT82880.1 hypothetical protein SAMN05216371_7688 [Streptomyces sp. TLI_053]
MRLSPKLVGPAVAVCLALGGTVAAAPPAPDAPSRTAAQYCATVVSKTLDPAGHSRVLGEACSSVSREDALALADAPNRTAGRRNTPVRTLLLEEYKDVDRYDSIYSMYGDAGGCDAEGYHLFNYIDIAENVSSMDGYYGCNKVHLWNMRNQESNPDLDLPAFSLGSFNDSVRELQVYRG